MLDTIDRTIVNRFQREFPLTSHPFAEIGAAVGIPEAEAIERIQRMLDNGLLTRVGPVYDLGAIGKACCVCAIAVPAERCDEVAGKVNERIEVAQSCERDHTLNLWFDLVVDAQSHIDEVCGEIQSQTGLVVVRLPKQREFSTDFTVSL
jgi:siroheme decarboxylase